MRKVIRCEQKYIQTKTIFLLSRSHCTVGQQICSSPKHEAEQMAEPETFTIQPRTPPVEINSETDVIECVLRYKLNRRAVALAHFSQEATREKIDEEQKRTWRAEYDNATVDLVQYMLTQYTYLAENNALYVLGMCYHNERLWEEFTKVKGNYDEEAVLLVIFPKDDPHKEPIVIETS
eukprot:GEMP01071218.1.p1 GENE.GEMP01071218.1~~GEMP01071218.1.p1  ORF type:complete len:178 (-),score=13.06 GEMP01071218.1:629-1162(-)